MCQDELEKLNSIVWPAIRQLAQREITNAANSGNIVCLFYRVTVMYYYRNMNIVMVNILINITRMSAYHILHYTTQDYLYFYTRVVP